jgi:hypothetical protein
MAHSLGQTRSVMWQPSDVPRLFGLMRAALLSAVVAVLGQSVVNVFFDTRAWLLHAVIFALTFPLVIWATRWFAAADPLCEPGARLMWSDRGVCRVSKAGQIDQQYQVSQVANYGVALVVTLRALGVRRSDTTLTLWKSRVDPVSYREISFLTHCLARRRA